MQAYDTEGDHVGIIRPDRFTHMRTARSLSLEELKGLLAAYPEDWFTMYTEADAAFREQLAGKAPGERLYIAGSLYLVGEIKESLDHDQFEEELKKFHPSLEVEDAEEAIYNQDLTDAADLLVKMMKKQKKRREIRRESMFVITAAAICRSMISVHPVEQMYPSIKDHVHVQPFYNDGLEKAGVRDLTGAINSLRQSLKFNKIISKPEIC